MRNAGIKGATPVSGRMPMWKAEFRAMSREERAELRRTLEGLGARSWLGRLFERGNGSNGQLRDAVRRDLECGKVQVIHAAAEAAVRLANADGSLAGFFADIGNGLVMFIESRVWDGRGPESDFESLFPCSRFSLVRAPHSGVDLEFTCEGARFEAVREVQVPSLDVLDAFIKDGEFLSGRLESLEEDFRRLFHPGPRVRLSSG